MNVVLERRSDQSQCAPENSTDQRDVIMIETDQMEKIIQGILKNMFGDTGIGDVRVDRAHDDVRGRVLRVR